MSGCEQRNTASSAGSATAFGATGAVGRRATARPTVVPGHVEAWTRDARELAASLAPCEPELDRMIRGVLNDLARADVTLAFGGHFKSGKSTVVNAAIGRPLLPVDDLPETGALCILRSGARDQGLLFDRGGRPRTLDCSTDAIRQVVSLIGPRGEDNATVLNVDRLELTLQDVTIPQAARWIDSPGINDTSAMNQRAERAANASDVLVWVLSSRQPLAEVEMEFVRRHIQSRGPTAVVFVLNAFLSSDTAQAWTQFQERNWPILFGKVREFAPGMGYSDQVQPVVVLAAGRPLAATWRPEFGGRELRELLSELSDPGSPRVVCSRLGGAATVLSEVRRRLDKQVSQARQKANAARLAREQAHAAAAARRTAYRRDVGAAFRKFCSAWSSAVGMIAVEVANSISAENLVRDESYGQRCHAELVSAAERLRREFLDDVSGAAKNHGQDPPTAGQRGNVAKLLTPQPRAVGVPRTEPDYSAAKAVALGGAGLGFFTFGLTGLFGAAAAVPLAVKAEREAAAQDASAARSNARAACLAAAREFDALREKLADQLAPELPPLTDGDDRSEELAAWETLRDRGEELARRAARIASGEGTL